MRGITPADVDEARFVVCGSTDRVDGAIAFLKQFCADCQRADGGVGIRELLRRVGQSARLQVFRGKIDQIAHQGDSSHGVGQIIGIMTGGYQQSGRLPQAGPIPVEAIGAEAPAGQLQSG